MSLEHSVGDGLERPGQDVSGGEGQLLLKVAVFPGSTTCDVTSVLRKGRPRGEGRRQKAVCGQTDAEQHVPGQAGNSFEGGSGGSLGADVTFPAALITG